MQCGAAAGLLLLGAAQGRAQAQADITLPTIAADEAQPGAAAMSLARALVAKIDTGEITAVPGLGMAMAQFMPDLHITPREHVRTVFAEAVVPVLRKHAATFREIEARSYARDMSLDDLKAINAFYDSPAGLALLRMHAGLLKLNMAGLQQLLQTLKPEIASKVDEDLKARGWTKGN